MEFISDNLTPLTAGDLSKVFVYSHAPATVITLLKSQAKLVEKEYETENDWDTLLQKLPSIRREDGDSGFVLLMTPRILGNAHSKHAESLRNRNDEHEKSPRTRHETTIFEDEESLGRGGQRQTRILPFSRDVFSRVSRAFHTHRSISLAVNRADVPLFSHEEVFMQDEIHEIKARVYNCRSTNDWGSDLAMTVTHFPHCKLSFGILFGCTASQKNYVLQRLRLATQESAHPLLLPAVFAEIERKRHHVIFEAGVLKLESIIPQSDMEALLGQQQSIDHADGQDKRTVYLDMLHLKHNLNTWSQQLDKLLQHALNLDMEILETRRRIDSQATVNTHGDLEMATNLSSGDFLHERVPILEEYSEAVKSASSAFSGLEKGRGPKLDQENMTRTNARIIKRVNTILEDYSDKIRECQTRFDGLTMTTQLSQGQVSVILAMATRQDSHHMRTIALVSMVFLPGTFFAAIFSMTFFNWQAGDGESVVSPLFWIYIAFSVVSTIAILLVYYYFVALRPKKPLASSADL